MKKHSILIVLTLAVLTMLALPLMVSAAPEKITVAVNGKLVSFPDQQPYIDSANRTLVPVRFPAETLGATVDWDAKNYTVTIDQAGDSILPKANIQLKIGDKNVLVNGQTQTMDTTAIITNNRTMVPIRFVSEYLGATVKWQQGSQTVHVFTKGQSESEQQQIMDQIAKELVEQTPVPKPGEKVIHSDELEKIYKVLQGKGYNVSLPTFPNAVNNYGCIAVSIDKNSVNKAQYDADVCEQIGAYVGTDGAKWANKILYACGSPAVTKAQQAKVFGDKAIAIYLLDTQYNGATNKIESCQIVEVDFSDLNEFRR